MKLNFNILNLSIQLILAGIVLVNIRDLFESDRIYLLGLLFGWQVLSNIVIYFTDSFQKLKEARGIYIIAVLIGIGVFSLGIIINIGGIFLMAALLFILMPLAFILLIYGFILAVLEVIEASNSNNNNNNTVGIIS